MIKFKQAAHLFVLFLVLSGCTYSYLNRRHQVVKKKYEKDTLFISSHILCIGLYRYSLSLWEFGSPPTLDIQANFQNNINTDSLYKSFKISMGRANIPAPIQYDNRSAINHCDDSFLEKKKMKFKDFQKEKILEIIGDTKGKTVLFPAIFIENDYRNEASGKIIGGEAMGGGSYYIKNWVLRILILIIQDNEIAYLRAGMYIGDSYWVGNKQNPTILLEQKHWDKLIKRIMKDYIDRLETNHNKEEPTKDYWQKY